MGRRSQNHDDTPPAPVGSNVTDQTRKEYYKRALKSQQEIDNQKEILKACEDDLKAVLKGAKAAGVSEVAIKAALKARNRDRDELIKEQQDIARMMAISGVWPSIQVDMFSGYTTPVVQAEETTVDVAYDQGHTAGVKGENRTVNGYVPGTEQFEAWDRGWITGQSGNVERLIPAERSKKHAQKLAAIDPENPLFSDE